MLSLTDTETYRRDGFLVLPELFTPTEVAVLLAAFERDARVPGDHRITEPSSDDVRAVYASHLRQPEFDHLIRSRRILGPALDLLGPSLYLYQMKINAKPAFGGGGWAWHQDYIAWKIADNIAGPDLINVVVFLDEVNEFNGPIVVVPGSHTAGLWRADRNDHPKSSQHVDPDDIALAPADMTRLVAGRGLAAPKGGPGSVMFFHPELVHGSAVNMSPSPRRIAIITYNETDNVPRPIGPPRPEHLVCRDTRPLSVADSALVASRR
jgi:ectoine hydroxylase